MRTAAADALPAAAKAKNYGWIYVVVIGAAISIGLFFLGRYSAVAPRQTDTAALSQKSIAVLPFVNMSPDANDEYLSDGMTEELLNVLSKVKGLRVPGRSSSFAFKGNNTGDIFRKVGEQLRVNTVLEGSVRKAGDKLRITAQLINVRDGYHLWSETYDRDMKDILAVESDVAQRVVEALKISLGVEQTRALTKRATENPEAHRLYLLGRYHAAKYTQADTADADRCFKQALQLDPNYALAYCGLADNYAGKSGNTMPGRDAWAKQRALAQKALELDPQLAEAHLALSNVLAGTFDWAGARTELNRALELNPNLAYAYDTAAWVLAVFGRFDESIANENKALELDPLNPLFNDSLGWYLYWARRYDEAIIQFRSVMELFPNDAFSHFVVGCCLFKTGKLDDAKIEIKEAIQLDDLPWYTGWLGYTYAVSGARFKAEQILHDLDELAKKRYVTPNARVPIYLGLGNKEKTLDELEKCYEDQDGACWWLKVDHVYDGIRNEPRFQALLKKVGLD
jgi:TolB-like protein/Flp pilus assembly protein TadD